MPRLDGQDGTSSSEENGVGNESCTTEVGTDTNVLDNSSGRSHGGNISEGTVELELAVGDWLFTERFQSSLKNDRVGGLVILDRNELFSWDPRVGEPSSDEVGLLELSQSLCVKSGFQLFQDISKLEYQNIRSSTSCASASRNRRSSRHEGKDSSRKSEES